MKFIKIDLNEARACSGLVARYDYLPEALDSFWSKHPQVRNVQVTYL